MQILSLDTTDRYPHLAGIEYDWDAQARKSVPREVIEYVPAEIITARVIGAWAERRGRDTHVMTVTFARYTHPKLGREVVEHSRLGDPGDQSDCRHHEVSWVLFRQNLDPNDQQVRDRYVTCEDCRARYGLPQIKDPRHYLPLEERPPRAPTKKELRHAAFLERFEAKYGQAPRHFETFQTTTTNTRLWYFKILLERPLRDYSRTPSAKRVTTLMQAAQRVADLEGNAALDAHVATVLGLDVHFGVRHERGYMQDDYGVGGKRLSFLDDHLSAEQLEALLFA